MQNRTWATKALTMHLAFYTSSVTLESQMRVEWGLLGSRDPFKVKEKNTKGEYPYDLFFCVGHTRPEAHCPFAALSNSS